MNLPIRICISLCCLVLSGTFSGLTLGLMSLGKMDLQVLIESGSEREKRHAQRILPVRERGNFLLCTLLIGNTAVNSALSIVTADLFGGVAGFIASTVGILYFGEIIPQAVCHRFGLIIGAYAIPLVKLFMILTAVISYPTAKLLDYTLGTEPTTRYNKSQLRSLLSIHGNRPDAEPDLENGEATKSSPFVSLDATVREISPDQPPNSFVPSPPPQPEPEPNSSSTDTAPSLHRKPTFRNAFNIPQKILHARRRNRRASYGDAGEDDNPRHGDRTFKRHKTDRKEQRSPTGLLTPEEMAIFGGAFEFGNKKVSEVMTHIDKVFMLDASLSLNFNVMLIIFQSGHSRIPVYENNRSNIIGVLFAKDLILLDPEDSVPIKTILHFFNRTLLVVYDDTPLFEMLNIFKQGRNHLAIVQRVVSSDDRDPSLETIGLATLEDLIEELIGEDIVDETDVYTDNVSRKPVKRIRSIDPEVLKMFDSRHVEERLSDKEVLVVASYLAYNTHEFSETCIRKKILRETLAHAPIEEYFDKGDWRPRKKRSAHTAPLSAVTGSMPTAADAAAALHAERGGIAEEHSSSAKSAEQSLRARIGHKADEDSRALTGSGSDEGEDDDIFIYKRGVPSINAYLILNGRLEIKAGNDGFISEAGPWTLLGVHALVDDLYAPDFTARVLEKPARLLRISRKFYRMLQQYSGENPLAPLVEDPRGKGSRVSPPLFRALLVP